MPQSKYRGKIWCIIVGTPGVVRKKPEIRTEDYDVKYCIKIGSTELAHFFEEKRNGIWVTYSKGLGAHATYFREDAIPHKNYESAHSITKVKIKEYMESAAFDSGLEVILKPIDYRKV